MFKKIFAAVISTVVTAYLTKLVTEALERKPLKTRVREGKETAVQLKDTAVEKAASMKNTVAEKAASMKFSAQMKAEDLKATAKAKADELIEEKDHVKVDVNNDRNEF